MNQINLKPEILAPAGSMDALRAAVYAGADAVYLGGDRFGARAYADNFDKTGLITAIEYCHLYGVKVFLTINTLFRNEEIKELYDYLCPLYEAGLDAVIVQDLGVINYVHQCFSDLPIHASTQMTITTKYAYSLLKNYGVTRIVPARELSIREIADLKTSGQPEIEAFVQGALCYCYSGACLMSSMIGGRSGNRGRCAQTCRLPYKAYSKGKMVKSEGQYLLSPKDLCGLESVKDLIAAGVDSFKIEGRMKRPEYVAVCVQAYREVVDAYFRGDDTEPLVELHKQRMAEVFNRGGFTKGYYQQHSGRDMMSVKNPGNIGVQIGRVSKIFKNQITISLSRDVYKGDILKLGKGKNEITLTCNVYEKANKDIVLNAPKTNTITIKQKVSRMYQAPLMNELYEYIINERLFKVKGDAKLITGQLASLTLEAFVNGKKIMVTAFGDVVEPAQTKPLLRSVAEQKLVQTGNTRYHFSALHVEVSDNAFYSLKELKDLRRQAFSMLEDRILFAGRRKTSKIKPPDALPEYIQRESEYGQPCVAVSSKEQYDEVCHCELFKQIYVDLQYFSLQDIINILKCGTDKLYYIILPPVMRSKEYMELHCILEQVSTLSLPLTGFVLRNVDEFAYLHSIAYRGKIITDYSLYAMNDYAVNMIRSLFPEAVITMPVELNQKQLEGLCKTTKNVQIIGYGYQQLMVSAQCLQQNLKECDHNEGWFSINDRYNKTFFTKCICKYCYNLVYNGVPTVLYDEINSEELYCSGVRLHFTMENKKDVLSVIEAFKRRMPPDTEITRGHWKRGVE